MACLHNLGLLAESYPKDLVSISITLFPIMSSVIAYKDAVPVRTLSIEITGQVQCICGAT